MKYLGVPIDNKKLNKCLWASTEEKVEKKLSLWKGRFLSLGGRLTLMHRCLTNVPLYMLSIYSAPKSVIRRIDIHRKNLLWQSGRDYKKNHLAKWEMVCTPKKQGGLGVLDLNCMNVALLSKWLWNIENSNGLWQEIIKAKYIKDVPLISVKVRQNDSHFWRAILGLRDEFYKCCKKVVGNGKSTSFWKNIWCGDVSLADKFPRLYNIARDKDITVEKVLNSDFQALSFRRRIIGDLSMKFGDLVACCNTFQINNQKDKVSWSLDKKGYSVKSFYSKKCDQVRVPYYFLWKTNVPQKIKVFLWLVLRNRILTKDNLKKRNWQGPVECVFCGIAESIDHLFFRCPVARYVWRVIQISLGISCIPSSIEELFGVWIRNFNKNTKLILFGCGAVLWSIWRARNDWCFGNKTLCDPSNVVFMCCFWLDSWAIRQKKKEKRKVGQGSRLIRRMASEVMCRAFGWCPMDRRISG
jgi:hypothetical protein